MKKVLVIVESPNKAKKISEILGEGYTVQATNGHIVELAKGGHHGIGVDIENGFKPKYTLMQDRVATLDSINKKVEECDEIVLLADPDREGISIAWHVQERIKGFGKPMKMTTTQEITKTGIKNAFKKLRDIDMNVVKAQEARRVLDRIVGFTSSPFLSKVENINLSAGRVQSVVVELVVDREQEIASFVPETYFTIDVNLFKDIPFKSSFPSKIKDEEIGSSIVEIIEKSDFKVDKIEDTIESKSPPAPLVTSTLQQMMSKLHGFNAEKTMKIAQTLYESGLITYIRTDAPAISKEALDEVREYLKNKNYKIPKKPNEYKSKGAAQEAHECIRPVGLDVDVTSGFFNLSDDEKKEYDVIWKYFVASQCEPAKFSKRKVIFVANNSDESEKIKLVSSGKCLIESNFMDILDQKDDSKIEIPNLVVGDIVKLNKENPVIFSKKKTKPPARFPLSDLIKELESRGIGRPSTFADILSRIEKRNYVELKGNVYHPTDLGKKITKILKSNFKFMDYDFTSKMEDDLDLIAEGKLSYLDMMNSFYPEYKKELTNAYIRANIDICKQCSSPMVIIKDKNPYCSNYRNCKKGNNGH